MNEYTELVVKHVTAMVIAICGAVFLGRTVSAVYDRKSDVEGSVKSETTDQGKHTTEANIKINDK